MQVLGNDRRHLGENALGRLLQLWVAQPLDVARADRDRVDLLGRKHQRRQIKAAAQDIAEAGGALDRHPARLQRRDIAVDRAHSDFEVIGEGGGGHRPGGRAKALHDVEQTVGAPHHLRS